ncbi:MAG: YdcF family protein [Chloroflexi bacterium]|nr:YdcF family protein [Chloroflexota bacterium]
MIAIAFRGSALFLATFTLIGLVGEARGGATDIGLWFVDLRDLPRLVQLALIGALGGVLVAWLWQEIPGAWLRRTAALVSLVFALLAARDVVRFAGAVGSGLIRPAAPIPLSALIAAALAGLAISIWRDRGLPEMGAWRARLGVGLAAVAVAALFPVLQIGFFGTTDYRRPADAAVVFGARVYASGTPSPLLADRIATGVELYRSGLVPVLVMSGGPGADGFSEAFVMREQAIAAGVDAAAVLVDETGITTEATVDHTIALLWTPSADYPIRLIAVSQAYHLPRIQLAFSGAGVDVLTVPAVDPVPISEMPLLVAREVPAFWLYYLRACLG